MNTTHILLVSYHRPLDLQESINSILAHTSDFHLHIIDNSCGAINSLLDSYVVNPCISIYKNSSNLGKGGAFMLHYQHIMKHISTNHFVSIDGDIKVSHNWLSRLISSANKLSFDYAMLAPTIIDTPGDCFDRQLRSNRFIMHQCNKLTHFRDEIYYNRYTAGPLFLINKQFFDSVGGYPTNQLYGNEDGVLCNKARIHNKFIGIVSNVNVQHMRTQEDAGYKRWKQIAMKQNVAGYWD